MLCGCEGGFIEGGAAAGGGFVVGGVVVGAGGGGEAVADELREEYLVVDEGMGEDVTV